MAIAKAIINEYQSKNVKEMQKALKDIFCLVFEAMLQGEMDSYLGCQSNNHDPKNISNRCKAVSFEPQAIPKHTKDVNDIGDKVLSM